MKVFVTGGNGFIGARLVKQLVARGAEVICPVRDPHQAAALQKMGAHVVACDVTDRARVRDVLRGGDAVFHLAGMYRFGPKCHAALRAVNVEGARNVLECAAEAGIPKIIHTSTIAVFGNTRGKTVDETYQCPKADLISEYERAKWEAHYEIAVPLQKRGAPVSIALPGAVTGAGDPSPHMLQVQFFLWRLPIGFGAKSGVTWAHVEDIAEGHIRVLERGKNGHAYNLTGPALTWQQSAEMWAHLTGIGAPKIWMPGWMVRVNQRVIALGERARLPLPVAAEVMRSQIDCTYWATADKARRELDWHSRPLQETFREMLDYAMRKRGKHQ